MFDSEFVYELCVCRWAELAWPPESASTPTANGARTDRPYIVARQLGTRNRRWDTIIIEADAGALADRAAFGDRELDSDLLHIVQHAPADWAWYREALPEPDYPWRYVREAIHRAADRGVLENRKNGNRIEIKRIAPYPDWFERLIVIENKPDLDASAARQLSSQLEHDVDTGLADEVWVATGRTDSRVEPALLEALPVEAGILLTDFADGVDADSISVEWYPTALQPTHAEGYRTSRRLELAERAYGRGWRTYHETMRPDCRYFQLRRHGRGLLPWCAAKSRHQSAATCGSSCADFEPEPPAWRMKAWPLAGGPGAGIKRLLADRRQRENR